MPQQLTQQESQSLTPSTLLNLYELDGTNIGLSELFRFYDGSANNYRPIVFDSITYNPFPIKMEEFSINGQGQVTRPKITVSNIRGFVSVLLLNNQSLIGAKLTRTRVYARFIDAVNFPRNKNPYGTPDPTGAYDPEIFWINRKIAENAQIVSWELSSLLEIDGVKLPRRQILANVCTFRYRDGSCKYTGAPVADRMNKKFVGGDGTYGLSALTDRGEWSPNTTYNAGDYVSVYSTLPQIGDVPAVYVCMVDETIGSDKSPLLDVSWVADACSKSCAGCRLRFPSPQSLRGGFFPGVAIAPFAVNR